MPHKLLKINIQNKLNIYDGTDGTVTSFTLVNEGLQPVVQ